MYQWLKVQNSLVNFRKTQEGFELNETLPLMSLNIRKSLHKMNEWVKDYTAVFLKSEIFFKHEIISLEEESVRLYLNVNTKT